MCIIHVSFIPNFGSLPLCFSQVWWGYLICVHAGTYSYDQTDLNGVVIANAVYPVIGRIHPHREYRRPMTR